jgi:hypothetical protein
VNPRRSEVRLMMMMTLSVLLHVNYLSRRSVGWKKNVFFRRRMNRFGERIWGVWVVP